MKKDNTIFYTFKLLSILLFLKMETTAAVTKKTFDFVVGVNGDFKAAMAAAAKSASSSNRYYIYFPNGDYNIGKLTGDANGVTTFPTSNVSFIGDNADSTIIFNQAINEGISITSTLYFKNASNLYLQDLSILNKANYRNGANLSQTGRYVAVREQGDRLIYKNVKLLSTQDTYYTQGTRTYWENGEIHGSVDFICGQGDIFFNECLLYLERDKSCITAPSTNSNWGYVFMNCTIDGTGSNHLLGRAWNNAPRCVYINTMMKKLPTAAAWGDPMNVVPKLFAEYNSKNGSGAQVDLSGRRTSYTKNTTVTIKPVLTATEASQYTLSNVLKGSDNWQPDKATKQVAAPSLRLSGSTLKWDDNDSALCWIILKDKKYFKCVTVNSCEIVPDPKVAYTVRAANAMGGLGPVSNSVDGTSTDVENIQKLSDHSISSFFDLTQKTLRFRITAINNLKVTIFSLNGTHVISRKFVNISENANLEIPMNGFNCGMYLLKTECDGIIQSGYVHVL
jgi:pectin methylesterase-like acyl-CoA thioesterase